MILSFQKGGDFGENNNIAYFFIFRFGQYSVWISGASPNPNTTIPLFKRSTYCRWNYVFNSIHYGQ